MAEGKKILQGAPTWMVTFADLMALLLTLFVMLLSFAEMDVKRYEQLAGNMSEAFGIQYLKKLAGIIESDGGPVGVAPRETTPKVVLDLKIDDVIGDKEPEKNDQETPPVDESLMDSVEKAIADEIANSLAKVEEREGEVIVRFPERVAFPSGTGTLTTEFLVALNNLTAVLEGTKGDIIIAGHTDDRPIHTDMFRSNWDLSTARANSVIHFLLENTNIDPGRLVAMGYADSRPLVANDSEANRAINRRVEVIIRKSDRALLPE